MRNLRTSPQPRVLAAGFGEQFRQLAHGGLAAGLLLVDGLIPEPPAASPLGEQRGLRLGAWPQAVGVPHRLDHKRHYTA